MQKGTPKSMLWLYGIAMAIFGLSILAEGLEMFRVGCNTKSVLQFHGLFHILIAVCLGMLYIYYIQENDTIAEEQSESDDDTIDIETGSVCSKESADTDSTSGDWSEDENDEQLETADIETQREAM
ncbi:MAG: hypothetical protein SGILL_005284 [Bacillariaceae sp.]